MDKKYCHNTIDNSGDWLLAIQRLNAIRIKWKRWKWMINEDSNVTLPHTNRGTNNCYIIGKNNNSNDSNQWQRIIQLMWDCTNNASRNRMCIVCKFILMIFFACKYFLYKKMNRSVRRWEKVHKIVSIFGIRCFFMRRI